MKRGQENGDSEQSAEKFPKMDVPPIKDFLSALPEDEFKLVLGHLNKEEKGNLKMVSKDYENKVMRLDPKMRSWHILFDLDNWKEVGMTLSEARIRHTLDGTIQDIKLSVTFHQNHEDYYTMVLMADNVINHWKSNIVHLSLKITGLETFLKDPELKMTQLKSLTFTNKDWSHDSPEIAVLISVLLEKHQDTLVKLLVTNKLPNISTPLVLNLKELDVEDISAENLIFLLETSAASLEKLKIYKIQYFDEENISQVKSLKIQIKKLKASKCSSRLVALLIKSSCSTLKNLEVVELSHNPEFNLETDELKLTSFSASHAPASVITTIVSAAQSSLKHLEIDCSGRFSDAEISSFQRFSQLNLKIISAYFVEESFLFTLLKISQTSLEDLSTEYLQNEESEVFSKINQMQLSGLMKFTSTCNTIDLTLAVINSSHASLQSLELDQHRCPGTQIQLNHERLHQLKKFKCRQIPNTIAFSIINASHLNLMNLELHYVNPSHDNAASNLTSPLVVLKTLSCSNIQLKILYSIMNSAHSTLEHLKLEDTYVYDKTESRFGLDQSLLELKSFTGNEISSSIVTTVLKSSPRVLNRITLKLDHGMKKINQFDSETTKLLIKVKSQNPFCILDI